MQGMGSRLISVLWLVASALGQTPPEGYAELPQMTGHFRGQPVTFRVWQGQALTEGDILLGPASALLADAKSSEREASVVSNSLARWPDRVVPYEIDAAIPEQQRLRDSIDEWNNRTVIKLKPREGEADFVRFTRVASGCSAVLGRIGGAQPVNLADNCSRGNIVHEIGHAIGLLHEQGRNDRADFVGVLYENIPRLQYSDFDRRAATADDSGPYDYGSIMHYGQLSFNITPRNSIQSIPAGIPIGQRLGLSAADIQSVARLYEEPIREVVIDTYPSGVSILVDGERHVTPKAFPWSPGEVHTIEARDRLATTTSTAEYRLARWSDGGAAVHSVEVAAGTTIYIASYALYYQVRTGVTPEGAGAVEVSPPSPDGFYPSGTLLHMRATPADGFRFFRWVSGSGTFLGANEQGDGANPVELSIRATTANYVASFLDRDFSIVGATRPGTLLTVDGQQVYAPTHRDWAPDSVHTIAIDALRTNADAGLRYRFDRWSNEGERQQTFTAAGPVALTAHVTRQYRIDRQVFATRFVNTPAATLQNLVLSPSGDGWYDEDAAVEVRAVENTGLPFSNWTSDIGGRTNPQTVTVTRNTLLAANFIAPPVLNDPSVVNDASQQRLELAPGMLFTMYTPGIGSDTAVEAQPAGDGSYPTELNGVSVLVAGTRAGIVRLTKGSLTAIAPASLPARKTYLIALESGGVSRNLTVPAQFAAPGVYTFDGSGRGNASDAPAAPGGTARVRVTGLAEGYPVSVEVAGLAAEVLSVQPESPGIARVEFQVPFGAPPGPAVPIVVACAGARSQTTATIAVE